MYCKYHEYMILFKQMKTAAGNGSILKEVTQMAIVTKDGERLYLRAWEYNAARIITAVSYTHL